MDEDTHQLDTSIAVFDSDGELQAWDEMCSCAIPHINMNDLPKGSILTVLPISFTLN